MRKGDIVLIRGIRQLKNFFLLTFTNLNIFFDLLNLNRKIKLIGSYLYKSCF